MKPASQNNISQEYTTQMQHNALFSQILFLLSWGFCFSTTSAK